MLPLPHISALAMITLTLSLSDPPRPLKSVTPGTSDVSPLSRDLRIPSGDLRQPSGFDRVYELRMGPNKTVRYARIDGALVAIFPQSTYTATQLGNIATIPPGTTFYIGRPEDIEARGLGIPEARIEPSAGSLAVPNYVPNSAPSTRADLRATDPVIPRYEPPTIWNDAVYRKTRLAELLDLGERSSHK